MGGYCETHHCEECDCLSGALTFKLTLLKFLFQWFIFLRDGFYEEGVANTYIMDDCECLFEVLRYQVDDPVMFLSIVVIVVDVCNMCIVWREAGRSQVILQSFAVSDTVYLYFH